MSIFDVHIPLSTKLSLYQKEKVRLICGYHTGLTMPSNNQMGLEFNKEKELLEKKLEDLSLVEFSHLIETISMMEDAINTSPPIIAKIEDDGNIVPDQTSFNRWCDIVNEYRIAICSLLGITSSFELYKKLEA